MDDQLPYSKELEIALLAVQRASLLTKKVLAAVDKGAMNKSDASPVTIADFGAQALLISAIHYNFPNDGFIGEEAADALRENATLCDRVWDLVSSTQLEVEESKSVLGTMESKEEMLDVIDLGGRSGRVWILDPIDGTATFIRNQQYAVCLALVEGGRQKIGVLGCPNLKLDDGQVREDSVDSGGYGLALSAVQGQGTSIRPMSTPGTLASPRRLDNIREVKDLKDLRWVESVKSASISPKIQNAIAEKLGASWPGVDLWSMQMKYVALAVGACDVTVRVSPDKDFRACVWDHAGGQLLFGEVGGVVTDSDGKAFDFGLGSKLDGNFGLVAASKGAHNKVLEVVKEIKAMDAEGRIRGTSRKGEVSGA